MKSIGISGTPGTGKSSIAKILSHYLGIPVIDLSKYVIENNLILFYDSERQTNVIDEDRVRLELLRLYNSNGAMIIDSHYAEITPKEILEVVFIIRRDPEELLNILLKRGWSLNKVIENVEAELFSICTLNAIDELGEDLVIEINATSRNNEEIALEILEILFGEKSAYYGHTIDWFSILPQEKLLKIIELLNIKELMSQHI